MRWKISNKQEDYNASIKFMETEVQNISDKKLENLIWILEYPPLYTAGLSAKPIDLLNKNKFPIFNSNRGGKYTYHGPGQRVIYTLINLNNNKDIGKFVSNLENIIIGTLNDFGIKGLRNDNHHGIFVKKNDNQSYKIASIGCRFKNWISYHGFSINHNPTLEHYSGINPCGLNNKNITSIEDLGKKISKEELNVAIKENILRMFKI